MVLPAMLLVTAAPIAMAAPLPISAPIATTLHVMTAPAVTMAAQAADAAKTRAVAIAASVSPTAPVATAVVNPTGAQVTPAAIVLAAARIAGAANVTLAPRVTPVRLAAPAIPPRSGEAGWQWPLRPPTPVLRRFDPPAHPWEPGHRGVDLAAPPGRPVFAAGAGRVTFARDLAGRGVLTISHGTLRTTYLPVRPVVRTGQTVVAGTRIGVVEAVLGHCGRESCLHWGLLRGDSYLDPLSLLGLGPVRLLPWWHSSPDVTVTGGEGRRPRTPTGPAQQAQRQPVLRPIARSPASSPDAPLPSRTPVGTAPAMRPVGATTGIGAIVDPVAITAAAGLALFGLHTRRRRNRIPTRLRRHHHPHPEDRSSR
ncbi:M23 family metallopeptidase [Actinoallomurus soli]|uniref:M23 family metallopeptidase n=1 Tax=Actinoallomurus soli TaxID=2952535 RepID=UPI002091F963|nr:M23 family metallopeptidase [Actinoallomurus soli]MCO5971078.1 M23 family metallopeptidase [Actinoallomurus soli]